MGIQNEHVVICYGNALGILSEYSGNALRILWGYSGNTLGTLLDIVFFISNQKIHPLKKFEGDVTYEGKGKGGKKGKGKGQSWWNSDDWSNGWQQGGGQHAARQQQSGNQVPARRMR